VFQKVEAATENERRPTVDRRYGGTSSCCVNDDRNRRRPGRFDTGTEVLSLERKSQWVMGGAVSSKPRRPPLLLSIDGTDRRTDGRTSDRFVDPAACIC